MEKFFTVNRSKIFELGEKVSKTNASNGINLPYLFKSDIDTIIKQHQLKQQHQQQDQPLGDVYQPQPSVTMFQPEQQQQQLQPVVSASADYSSRTSNSNSKSNSEQNASQVQKTTHTKTRYRKRKKMLIKRFKNALPCMFVWLLLISLNLIYYVIVWPKLVEIILNENNIWPFLVLQIFKAYLLLMIIVNYLISTYRDPGYLPKSHDNEINRSQMVKNLNSEHDPDKCLSIGSTWDVNIMKEQVTLKWCSTCKFYRPPRCSHCKRCDACVEAFDHHCEWINNCIGKRNYKFFLNLLLCILIYVTIVIACMITLIIKTQPVLSSYQSIVALVLTIIIFIFALLIAYLYIFHLYLINTMQTTNEYNKSRAITGLNRECFVKNCHLICCSPFSPSYKRYLSEWHKKLSKLVKSTRIGSNEHPSRATPSPQPHQALNQPEYTTSMVKSESLNGSSNCNQSVYSINVINEAGGTLDGELDSNDYFNDYNLYESKSEDLALSPDAFFALNLDEIDLNNDKNRQALVKAVQLASKTINTPSIY